MGKGKKERRKEKRRRKCEFRKVLEKEEGLRSIRKGRGEGGVNEEEFKRRRKRKEKEEVLARR